MTLLDIVILVSKIVAVSGIVFSVYALVSIAALASRKLASRRPER